MAAAPVCALLLASQTVHAFEAGSELGFGEIRAPGLHTRFISEQLAMESELTDAWLLSASAGIAHFLPTSQFESSLMSHFGLGAGFQPDPHLELDLDLHASPTYSLVQTFGPERYETRANSLGGALSVVYATEGSGPLELHVDASGGLVHYAARSDPGSSSGLLQFHGVLTATATLSSDTDVTLSGSCYAYRADHLRQSGTQLILTDGVPLEPIRFAIRPTLTRRLGALTLSLHGQYAGYIADLGRSWNAGARLQYALREALQVSVSAELTRAIYSDGARLALDVMDVGLVVDW